MKRPVRIVGQGMAGSMLAWHCERAGIDFELIDRGHALAASRVGAGLVSPLTGKRLAPTWRFAEWRDEVLAMYRELESELGLLLVREMKIRRFYRDADQRAFFERRIDKPEIAAWVDRLDDDGLWLNGALQVETGTLIAALRERWLQSGRMVEGTVPTDVEGPKIWCVGAEPMPIRGIPWEPSRGELITGQLAGLEQDVVLNDGKWLLPMGDGSVRVGSTFDRDDLVPRPTVKGQTELREAAERLAGRLLEGAVGDAGLRVALPDRRPVMGWVDDEGSQGVFVGLAAKGALWAPALAQQWVADGLVGAKLDAEVRVGRFLG